jgi:flagellar hook assembly protein FlgD
MSYITLKVYNLAGQRVSSLVSQVQRAGKYQVQWDGKDFNGREVASGVYIYSLDEGDYQQLKKMILLK